MHLVVLAVAGALVAGYLTLVQLRTLAAWDPLFGAASTNAVLHSAFSRALPVPDALLGFIAYLCEVALGVAASPRRSRDRPWIPAAFEAIALGAAIGGLALVAVQGLVVDHWCSACLLTALLSVSIVVLSGPHRLRRAWRVTAELLADR